MGQSEDERVSCALDHAANGFVLFGVKSAEDETDVVVFSFTSADAESKARKLFRAESRDERFESVMTSVASARTHAERSQRELKVIADSPDTGGVEEGIRSEGTGRLSASIHVRQRLHERYPQILYLCWNYEGMIATPGSFAGIASGERVDDFIAEIVARSHVFGAWIS